MLRYELLETPFRIGRLTIKNRFCMAPIGGEWEMGTILCAVWDGYEAGSRM